MGSVAALHAQDALRQASIAVGRSPHRALIPEEVEYSNAMQKD